MDTMGGIIIDHDTAYIVEQAELIGWVFDGVFICWHMSSIFLLIICYHC